MRIKFQKSTFTFATVNTNLDELTPEINELFQKNLRRDEEVQTILTAPSQRIHNREGRCKYFMPWKITPSWVLVMTNQRMLIATIEFPGAVPSLKTFSFDQILTIELGRVLLFAWVEWDWAVDQGVDKLRIYFNAVDDTKYHKLVMAACRERIDQFGYGKETEKRNLDLLNDLPYKFRNIISIELLLPDEAIQSVVFRPAVHDKLMGLLRKLRAPALALIRTNYHVLTMREDEGDAGSRYGVVFRYIPLDVIKNAEIVPGEDFLKVTTHLQKDGSQDCVLMEFLPHQERDVRQVLAPFIDEITR